MAKTATKKIYTPLDKSQQRQTEYVMFDADYSSGMTASDVRLRNMIRNKVSKMRSREQLERLAKVIGIDLM